MYTNLATIITHSKLLDLVNCQGGGAVDGGNAIVLWYYARAIDRAGSGYAEFSIEQAGIALNKSRATIYRYLSDGKALGLFRAVKPLKRGMVGVWLTSRDRVTARYCGSKGWGAAARVAIDALQHHKILSAEIATASLQRSSEYLANRHNNTLKRKKSIADVSRLVKSSQLSRGHFSRSGTNVFE